MRNHSVVFVTFSLLGVFAIGPSAEASIFFSTGNPDGMMASASRPDSSGKFEIETADDFVLGGPTSLTGATFTGLLTTAVANITNVRVEIYRVFPTDSDVGRTSGPPIFSTSQVPTRVNSPSDVAFDDRDAASANLSYQVTSLGSFTANNSIQPGGIHPLPNPTTGGNGALTGQEVQFDVSFLTALLLPANHYFFVPQVQVSDANGNFYWLSAARPIVPPGTPFPQGFTDLQGWTRDAALDPDWLRVGTDIVGAGTFNYAFSLSGESVTPVPLPAALPLLASSLGALGFAGWRRSKNKRSDLTM